jgi:ATP-dependent helicase/nuclease subunit A
VAPVLDFTPEQLSAIERRSGDLLLDASAGSGKTSVLVERFAQAVLNDGVDVAAILTITFTDKAAAELRDRIRARFRALGEHDAARATEGAFISTIHGFCARVLRANALAAGLDPSFTVLDEPQAAALADAAFDGALDDLARLAAGGIGLIASYGAPALRGAILGVHGELRSRGQTVPRLPDLPPAPDLQAARAALTLAAAAALGELGAVTGPSVKVISAIERLERVPGVVALAEPGLTELAGLSLPGGNGAALSTSACSAYRDALERFRTASEYPRAQRARDLLDDLLSRYGERYGSLKRDASGLDFEDLELMTRDLLAADDELRERYRARFEHLMVDELQDTNKVQLDLIESISRGNLFTVGDAQQSIYGFRHADVELFERRGERLEAVGARQTLATNFRSRKEIIEALNGAFGGGAADAGVRFTPLKPGRTDPPADGPLVELLVVDKGADWTNDGLAAPWRLAESRALARRVLELLRGGAEPREIVVLTRATTDLRAYERALEDVGVPTYLIGGRGYWSHPQVVDLVSYLRSLANPRDEQALYTVLSSPLVGVSLDALVVLAAAARESGRDPWWLLREPDATLDGLPADDAQRLASFAHWFAAERTGRARRGTEELIVRALELTDYDLTMVGMPGGERRLANVRKLMRLGREYEARAGLDLRGFLELVSRRAGGWSSGGGGAADVRESEAPVEGEALNAIRLMTIHRAKGLEFPIVVVADLGRGPRRRAELMRIGRDGRFGLRLAEPGTGKREPALAYDALGAEQQQADEREERRLFYVAMTRAMEQLILSGAAKVDAWTSGGGGAPMGWIGPAFVPDLEGGIYAGIAVTVVRPEDDVDEFDPHIGGKSHPRPAGDQPAPLTPSATPPPAPVSTLSYSSLAEYERCGYRFYAERVLGLPAAPAAKGAMASRETPAGLTGAERGVIAHALLEKLDFRRPSVPTTAAVVAAAPDRVPNPAEADGLVALIEAFTSTEMCARLGRATDVRREERFGFLLESGVLITGALDVLAREPDGRTLVVDYKSDRLDGADPAALVQSAYATQRLIYALAAIRVGATDVEVAHVFLEAPGQPVTATFGSSDAPELERQLQVLAGRVLDRRFQVADAPHRALCNGCPAEGGLCSWPLELTRRDAIDQLF